MNMTATQARYSGNAAFGNADAATPDYSGLGDRIAVSVERVRALRERIAMAADTLHGHEAESLSGKVMAGPIVPQPVPSVTKRIIDLADAVDALEAAVCRLERGL